MTDLQTIRTSALAVTALVIAAAALAFDAGRTSGGASCPTHQHRPTLVRALR
jgi:hypothetical protein